MEMMIDEAIKVLEQHHMWTGEPQEIIDVKVENSAMGVAIDTMRKYQKIEEIVKQYKKFGNIDFSMQIISEVVENGND